jgi:hypothetical protein
MQHKVLQEFAPQNYTLLDPADLFLSSKGLYRVAAGGRSLYNDGGHISVHGAQLLRPLLMSVFE